MIRRLLIANRGEIAVRIIRTCHEMGVEALAVYSEADRNALHVRLADRAYPIGPAPATSSYLDSGAILEAAQNLGADAVHPGYGFLSERYDFAQRCIDAGLIFVGPGRAAMRLLGDKTVARRLMAAAGIPVVPGYDGDDQSDGALAIAASRIGYPVLVKSAAGGGGRGMRLVLSSADLPAMLAEARQESQASSGDERLLLERYIESPRHVEVQILADTHGNVIHLFERECSIQRRNQKIIEETPSSAITPKLRRAMAETAVEAARNAGYVNAGTVEFLVETRGRTARFYFLEVNTRIQVEHPVTEAVTGVDLVRCQLMIAAGEPLGLVQKAVAPRGHAIEARVYAEDPAESFMPSAGTIRRWIEPAGPGIRVDAGYCQGSVASPHYDAMLAKVIAHAPSRPAAIARLRAALEQFCILGIKTNVAYLLDIISHPAFEAAETPTTFLSDNLPAWAESGDLPADVLLAASAVAVTTDETVAGPAIRRPGRPSGRSLWQAGRPWRNV